MVCLLKTVQSLQTEARVFLFNLQLLFFRQVIYYLEKISQLVYVLSVDHARHVRSTTNQLTRSSNYHSEMRESFCKV